MFEAEFYSTGFPVDFRHQKRKKKKTEFPGTFLIFKREGEVDMNV